MKRFISILFLILALSSCGSMSRQSSAAGDSLSLRVGTYNLWRSDLGKGEYAWESRKFSLAQSIVENGFDLFAAEEVDTTMFRELPPIVAASGGEYSWFTFSPYDKDGKGSVKAQALVYRKDRFRILEDHHFWFSLTPDRMSSAWDELKFKRGGCCFTMEDIPSGHRFFVMVSHMPLGKDANLEAAKIIVSMAEKYNPGNLPAFFVGDLNTRPESESSVLLRKYWMDSYESSVAREGSKGTFNSHNVAKNMEEAQRIDYVYYRSARITAVRYVVNLKKYGGLYASDHCPVYVDFKVKY